MTTFSAEQIDALVSKLPTPIDIPTPEGQPIHVVYGGADRFNAGTIAKLGDIARHSFADNAPDAASLVEIFGIEESVAARVHHQVTSRLAVCPIEDYRVDFEDGLGVRSDADEDQFAVNAAVETRAALAAESLSPFFGIRIRPLARSTAQRAIRTLDLYMSHLLADDGSLPQRFVVTLPKVTSPFETATLDRALTQIEAEFAIESGSIKMEFLAEEPRAFIGANGSCALPSIIEAANGRCRGVHLGAYDLLSSFGIRSSSQSLGHSFCDYARSSMHFATAGLGVWLSDGATNEMPIGKHRGAELAPEQLAENELYIRYAWRTHFANCQRAIEQGFYQGWDLHPAQVPARLVAEFVYIAKNINTARARFKSFTENSERSTLTGGVFDDAATGRGLEAFFRRARALGAVSSSDPKLQ